MPTIEVDLVFFVLETIFALLMVPFIIGFLVYKGYKSPEFWLRLRKKDWVYLLIRNPMMKLLVVAFPLDKMGADGELTVFNRTYFWKEKYYRETRPNEAPDPKNGLPTVFGYKKKVGAVYDWNDPYPQVWVPGNSLSSMTDPQNIASMKDMKILQLLMNADSMTGLMRTSLIISIIAAVAVAGLAFAVFTGSQATTDALTRVYHILNNTRTGP